MKRTDLNNHREDEANPEQVDEGTSSHSPFVLALLRLGQSKAAIASGCFLVFISIACFAGPPVIKIITAQRQTSIFKAESFSSWYETGYDYRTVDSDDSYQSPSWPHIFGTDQHGRDIFLRILYGGQISLLVGFVATFVSIVIGVSWGAIAGYVGGWVDTIMMRIVDALYGLPFLFLVILVMTLVELKTLSVYQIMLILFAALGAVQWLTMSRIVRGEVLSIKEKEYVEAANAIGVPDPLIIIRYILPNLVGPVIVYATLTVPQVILREAFLSFLGLGIQPPFPSWGSLMSDGATTLNPIEVRWWLILFPALFLALTLLSLNLLGDQLRDALDPRTRIE